MGSACYMLEELGTTGVLVRISNAWDQRRVKRDKGIKTETLFAVLAGRRRRRADAMHAPDFRSRRETHSFNRTRDPAAGCCTVWLWEGLHAPTGRGGNPLPPLYHPQTAPPPSPGVN